MLLANPVASVDETIQCKLKTLHRMNQFGKIENQDQQLKDVNSVYRLFNFIREISKLSA